MHAHVRARNMFKSRSVAAHPSSSTCIGVPNGDWPAAQCWMPCPKKYSRSSSTTPVCHMPSICVHASSVEPPCFAADAQTQVLRSMLLMHIASQRSNTIESQSTQCCSTAWACSERRFQRNGRETRHCQWQRVWLKIAPASRANCPRVALPDRLTSHTHAARLAGSWCACFRKLICSLYWAESRQLKLQHQRGSAQICNARAGLNTGCQYELSTPCCEIL